MSKDLKVAAAYIRVSTEDQTEYSPDAQLVEIRRYAAKENYIIPDAYIYFDEGITGRKTEKREAFNRMIGDAKTKPKPFETILLWKFSRFARNREDSVVYKSMLRKQLGIDVVSISEPVGDDKMSVLIEALIEAMDEYYSINLAEEVTRGMTEKARRGELQSIPSFGYHAENGQLIQEPAEAELVRQLFTRFISGEGLYPLARWFNDIGIKTHRGNSFENRTIEYILRNPVYIGKLRWTPSGRAGRDTTNENTIVTNARHEPIIDPVTWEKAQECMAAVKAQWKYKGRPVTELKDWPSGLVRCAACNATMIFSKPYYYKCNNYAKGRCTSSQHVKADLIKDAIIERLSYDRSFQLPLVVNSVQIGNNVSIERDRLRMTLETSNKKMLRLHEAFLVGAYSADEYKKYKQDLTSSMDTIRARLNELANNPADVCSRDLLKEALKNTLEILRSPFFTVIEKHNAVKKVIESCIWDKAQSLLKITYRLYI